MRCWKPFKTGCRGDNTPSDRYSRTQYIREQQGRRGVFPASLVLSVLQSVPEMFRDFFQLLLPLLRILFRPDFLNVGENQTQEGIPLFPGHALTLPALP